MWRYSYSAVAILAFVHAALQAGVYVAQTPGQSSVSLLPLLPFPAPFLSFPHSPPPLRSDVCDPAPLAEMIVLSPGTVLRIFLESRVNLHAGPLPGATLPR